MDEFADAKSLLFEAVWIQFQGAREHSLGQELGFSLGGSGMRLIADTSTQLHDGEWGALGILRIKEAPG